MENVQYHDYSHEKLSLYFLRGVKAWEQMRLSSSPTEYSRQNSNKTQQRGIERRIKVYRTGGLILDLYITEPFNVGKRERR